MKTPTLKRFAFVLALLLAFLAVTPAYANSITDLKKKQETIRQQGLEAQKNLYNTKAAKTAAITEMDALDAELNQVTQDLDVINRELEKTTQLYEQTQAELEEAVAEKDKQFQMLKTRVRFMYMRGKVGYLDIIFKSRDFSDLVNRIEYINRIVAYDQGLVKRLQATENLIATKFEETKQHKQEMQVLSNEQTTKMVLLEDKVKEKRYLVESLEADQEKYAQMIKNLDATDKELASLIKRKQAEATKASSASYVSAPYTGGKLNQPVVGRSKISSGYGPRPSPISGKSEFHTGIDIPAPTGTSIVSAESGVVIKSGVSNGYGNTIVVDHGNGLSTMYAHCSKLIAKVGQRVERGEVIAKVGSTGYSTGPHLHFEVRVNGTTTNPVNYLN